MLFNGIYVNDECIKDDNYVTMKVIIDKRDDAYEILFEDIEGFHPYMVHSDLSNDKEDVFIGFMSLEKWMRIISMMDASPYGNGYIVYLKNHYAWRKEDRWVSIR